MTAPGCRHIQEHPLLVTDAPETVRRMWLAIDLGSGDPLAVIDVCAILPTIPAPRTGDDS